MTEEKAKSLIGRKVRGFKFESETDEVFYTRFMDKLIGEIGKITDYFDDCFTVKFKDNYWGYPASLIEAHLVEESVDRKISDFKEGEHLIDGDYLQVWNDNQFKTANITASELINQNEQLKAENAELVGLIEAYIFGLDNGQLAFYDKYGYNVSELSNKFRQTLEKHGK